MGRVFRISLNQALLAAVPLALGLAWLTGWWTVGAAVALAALCVLAVRNPTRELAALGEWLPRSALPRLRPLLSWPRRADETPEPTAAPQPRVAPRSAPAGGVPGSLVSQMISQGRVALLLRPQIAANLSAADLRAAQEALDDAMAIVPQGPVLLRARCYDLLQEEAAARAERLVSVEGLFLDRFAVSNREYLEFVEGGGYEQMSLWDESIWPAVLSFVDATGQPGPRYWQHGRHLDGQQDHPVVGVCWYEACAFARWAGKRLPTDPEWVKSGTWPVFADGDRPVQRRYPWGESMDRKRANLWGSGHNRPIAVHALPEGASVNGVQQLVGNVWEWTSSAFGAWEPAQRRIETGQPLKSIRGGAFDTYFDTQAQCQFQSGEAPLARKHNIGFRCALGFCDVVHTADGGPSATVTHDTEVSEEALA